MKKTSKGLPGFIFGLVLVVLAFLPIWTWCSDACGPGSFNFGLIALGLGVIAFQALTTSKVPAESKRGCSIILLSLFLPATLLGFALMVNGWYLLVLGLPMLLLGLVILIFGIVSYTKSLK